MENDDNHLPQPIQKLTKLPKKRRKSKVSLITKAEPTKYGELVKCAHCKNLVPNLARHMNDSHPTEAYFTGMKTITNKKIRATKKICD